MGEVVIDEQNVGQLAARQPPAQVGCCDNPSDPATYDNDTVHISCPSTSMYRFRNSKAVGAVFGLKLSRYQSGESERTGRISRCGDEIMRMMLYEAAQSMLALNSAGACAVPNHGHSSRRCGLGSRRSWVAFLAQRPRRRDPLHPLPLAGALSFLG